MSIFIFSRPVHSGKTTELLHWCNQQKNIMGIAMPDINGSRKNKNTHTVLLRGTSVDCDSEYVSVACINAEKK